MKAIVKDTIVNLHAKPDTTSELIDEVLYGTKVFITPGFIFGVAGNRFIRISLCCPVEKLNEALARIESWQAKRMKSNETALAK